MGHIYFIMGVSGAGKGTLINNLKKSDLDLYIPLSYRSRAIRENEINGVDSHFISKGEFFHQIEAGEFLEYAIVHETDYVGTKYEDVINKGINLGKTVVKELDINGLKRLKKERPAFDSSYTTIFLNIPTEILRERIEKRGALMRDEELERRINSAIMEEEEARKLCDYLIDATKSEIEVLEEVFKIIKK
ncbi:MAG: hypothetical protein PHH06_04580 [Candidatus Gracilibacteria bacterium]|nr:hypothetical protein [Candidatus Gracilibacteria bacterium]